MALFLPKATLLVTVAAAAGEKGMKMNTTIEGHDGQSYSLAKTAFLTLLSAAVLGVAAAASLRQADSVGGQSNGGYSLVPKLAASSNAAHLPVNSERPRVTYFLVSSAGEVEEARSLIEGGAFNQVKMQPDQYTILVAGTPDETAAAVDAIGEERATIEARIFFVDLRRAD
jgi:hypothetical protein